MSLLLYYLGMTLLTSIVILIFEDVYGDRTSDTESALLFGILWPLTLLAYTIIIIMHGCVTYLFTKQNQ